MCLLQRYRTKSTCNSHSEYSTRLYRPNNFSKFASFDKVLVFAYGLGQDFSQNNPNVEYFARYLSDEKQIPAITFDYRGTGNSKYDFEETSLETRAEDTRHVLRCVHEACPVADLVVCGHDGGAAITASLGDDPEMREIISAPILTAPVAYHPDVWSEKFGEDFRKVLHSHKHWIDSHEFASFARFNHDKGIIICECDEIVSIDISQEYLHYSDNVHFSMLSHAPLGHKVFGNDKNVFVYRDKTLAYAKHVGDMVNKMLEPGPFQAVAQTL